MFKVLLASRDASALRTLNDYLSAKSDFQVAVRHIVNGHADPLYGIDVRPDLVVLRFTTEQSAELVAWAADAASRPALIVVGPAGNGEAMRLAIRAGAKDFLPEPVSGKELVGAISRVRDQWAASARQKDEHGSLHAIIGAAGGVGSSFIAANVAGLIASQTPADSSAAMLVDLDLNFSPLTHYFDVRVERGLLQAIELASGLDQLSLSGFGATHRSGLRLLCTAAGPAVLSKDVSADRLSDLLRLATTCHRQVVLDLPHVVDSLTATALGQSTDVILVIQQSLLHLRNAVRLLQILKGELGVSPERVRVVVNRYQKEALVQLDDIRRTLGLDIYLSIPSHYRRALESADTGKPLFEADRNSPVVKALKQLADQIAGVETQSPTGILRRALPGFLRN